jgi:hypothetical protein
VSIQHPELAAGRWQSFSLSEQLANVGSEVERALSWVSKGNPGYSTMALDRAIELLDLTIADPKHRCRLKELTRVREVLLDYFVGENEYGSSESNWRSYFGAFGLTVALRREAAALSADPAR